MVPPKLSFLLFLSLYNFVLSSEVLVGGPKEVQPEEIPPKILNFALNKLESKSNNNFARKIVDIKSARVQVVAGSIYTITFELATTGCVKQVPNEITKLTELEDKCSALNEKIPHEECTVKIWYKAWLNHLLSLTEDSCQIVDKNENSSSSKSRPKRSFIPGLVNILDSDERNQIHKMKQNFMDTMENQLTQVKSTMKRWMSNDEKSARELKNLQSHSNFKSFVKKFERNYPTKQEYLRRFKIFRDNMEIIQFLRDTEQASGQYGVTKFADFTEEEKSAMLGFKPELMQEGILSEFDKNDEIELLKALDQMPENFDWRDHGAVTPVKNQGSCGSCWAFSVTGNVEGQWKIAKDQLVSLSEQELVDCDKTDNGCNGGLPSNAYNAIVKLGGLEAESEYTYDGRDERCKFNSSEVAVKISGGKELPKNETLLQNWLVKKGPISIGINANAMMFYYGGVSHPWSFLCRKKGIDHGVLIVGYGTVKLPSLADQPYWIIKNSWGESWGEKGYYRVWRGDGTCGVDQMATTAVV